MEKSLIRNFCIIAHIDHGKSTLSDRIIEITNTVSSHKLKNQMLDTMDIERERGITIKLNAIQIQYWHQKQQKKYVFHLIDTPGHVDFTYEVSRSLAACEGALLVVDATQGIQAQTLSNVYLALENNLEIVPVINKIDLPNADVARVKEQIENIIGLDCSNIPLISAKTGLNIDHVLNAIINNIPPPLNSDDNQPLQALIFDSFYDDYKGVICLVRIKNGCLKLKDEILFMSNQKTFEVIEIGINNTKLVNKTILAAGEVGWLAASIKDSRDVRVGDTITHVHKAASKPLPGYKKILPMVFCGLYPIDNQNYGQFKEALMKIYLSDSSLTYEYENSQALGFGSRCGFLGLLHMDVIKERIEREFNIPLISTMPSVVYRIILNNNEIVEIYSAHKLPDKTSYKNIQEPFVKAMIITPQEYIGRIMELCINKRGIFVNLEEIDDYRKKIEFKLPLAEIIYNFFDKLKSLSKGYATLDYELIGYFNANLVRVDFLLNKKKIDALSYIVHKNVAFQRSKKICLKLKEIIPKHQFEIPIQAVIGTKVISRETISAMRKNVLAKCYGGDITRKKKLLEQQKKGKAKLKKFGNVAVPQDLFIKILKE